MDRGAQTFHLVALPTQWAMLPLRNELERIANGMRPITMDETTMVSALEGQEIALGFLSPLQLVRNPNFEMSLSAGLSVRGAGSGVFMGFQSDRCDELKVEIKKRIRAVQEIFLHANVAASVNPKNVAQFIWKATRNLALPRLSTAPRLRCGAFNSTGATLARLTYRLLFGDNAFETNEMIAYGHGGLMGAPAESTVEVVCGNDVLLKKGQFGFELDLGELWSQWTGLPLVIYIGQKNMKMTNLSIKTKVMQAVEMAQARMKIEPSTYLPDIAPTGSGGKSVDLAAYWKNLNYRMGPDELKSLRFFLQLAYPLEKKPIDEELLAVKMLRWQEREKTI